MRGRLGEIDLLRGYAVAMVVWLHLGLTDPYRGFIMQNILDATEMSVGVDLFFVISGFVIARALSGLWDVKTTEDAKRARNAPLTFYRKRFIRLWPASAVWLVLNVVLAGLFSWQSYWPPIGLVAAKAIYGFVYLYNFQEVSAPGVLGYFWSLSVEWQFYLLFPLFLLLIRNDAWRVAVLIVAFLLSVWLQPGGGQWRFFRFDGLVFGILLHVLLDRLNLQVPRYAAFGRPLYRHLVTLVLLVGVAIVPAYVPDIRIGYVFSNALGAVLVALAALDHGYISTLGLGAVVRWLGSRSYSIYLVHMPVILSVLSLYQLASTHMRHFHRLSFESDWYFAANLLLIPIVAELTYRLVEKPSHARSRAIRDETITPAGLPAG